MLFNHYGKASEATPFGLDLQILLRVDIFVEIREYEGIFISPFLWYFISATKKVAAASRGSVRIKRGRNDMKKQKVSTGDEMFLDLVQASQLERPLSVYFIKSRKGIVRTCPAQNKLPYRYLHIDLGLESLLRKRGEGRD